MTKVKELMVPVAEYVSVAPGAALYQAFEALARDRTQKGDKGRAHRDLLVRDDRGAIVGKITMREVFLALEPNYKALTEGTTDHDALTREYVARMFKEFDLWSEPLASLCRRGAELTAAEVMHVPAAGEFVDQDDDLEKAVHRYVVGVSQPLLVRDGEEVVGVLRLGDLFEETSRRILACGLGDRGPGEAKA